MVPPSAFVDFTLTSQDNKPISLGQLKGKPVLMIFGFTNCPDVCPITLGNFKQVRLLLQDKGKADAIHYLFISVDGARDNPERLKYYLSQFDPSFEGMMGDDSQLRVIVRQYGATFTLENVGGMKKENYSVSHTASSFLLDKDGNWIRKYAYQTAPELIANDILSVLG
jgi:protein SCO1/2